ncbi:MAG: flagellar motor switch protein FliM [Candidatus Tectomicrobia bacterium]|nr:flagellar motor switch protein FliM [Candidatus Tectomicrobia bacterium]
MDEVLTQDEVNALLEGIADGEVDTEPKATVPESGVTSYDLTNQDRIIRGRMPTLEVIHERFTRMLRTTLFGLLHRVIDVSVVATEMKKFGEFLKTVPIPASFNLFRMKPLRGMAIMVLESRLIFAFIDSLFGGSGRPSMKVEGRDFTEIENRVIKRIVLSGLKDLERSWKSLREVEIEFERSELNPQFASVVSPSDVVIVVNFELEMDQSSGSMMVCMPYSMVEPIRAELQAGFQADRLEADRAWFLRLVTGIQQVPLEIMSQLGATEISVRELLRLKAGDVIQLDSDADAPVTVFVEGIEKLNGYLGARKGSKAIQVASPMVKEGWTWEGYEHE